MPALGRRTTTPGLPLFRLAFEPRCWPRFTSRPARGASLCCPRLLANIPSASRSLPPPVVGSPPALCCCFRLPFGSARPWQVGRHAPKIMSLRQRPARKRTSVRAVAYITPGLALPCGVPCEAAQRATVSQGAGLRTCLGLQLATAILSVRAPYTYRMVHPNPQLRFRTKSG